MKVLISGGGTGGHVFPAIAIADALRIVYPKVVIHFVGALGKLEMQKVPEAGYKITGLPIRGFKRKWSMQNLGLLFSLFKCLWKASGILRTFKPDVVVGVGGYASGPVLKVASWMKLPILLQEQNSYPGVTNRLMSKAASKICVAFEGLEKYFDKQKIIYSGNPIRKNLLEEIDSKLAKKYFDLDPSVITVGIFGGSLGAKSINEAVLLMESKIKDKKIQLLWQTGSLYYNHFATHSIADNINVKMLAFIDNMNLAYSACDIVVSRAGALSLSELCIKLKPAILVPSPNVVEDHQRKNAEAMVSKNAARMILDADLNLYLWSEITRLIDNESIRKEMTIQIGKLAKPNAAIEIANEILELSNKN